MKDFGFGIKKSGVIDLDKADMSLLREIAAEEPSFLHCFYCGTCTATCSAGKYTGFNLRRLQLLIKRGQLDEVSERISECMLCGKCQWVCPKGVNTRHVVMLVNKNLHARKIR